MARQSVALLKRSRPLGAALTLFAASFLLLLMLPVAQAGALTADDAIENVYDTPHDVPQKPVCDAARNMVAVGVGELRAVSLGSRTESRTTYGFVAPTSKHIELADVANRTPQQIDDLVNDAGLIPRGPDPQAGRGAYIDPVTGQQRVLCHPGACPPHAHVNDPAGNRLDINGNIVSPESPVAHLPLSTDASP